MSHKLFAMSLALLLTVGCTSQQEKPAGTRTVSEEASKQAKTDAPLPAVKNTGPTQDQADHLKSVGMAFHQYHDHFGHFPPAASTDADGRPLLSWRVHLLPFLDAHDLYKQFHLDEPWDSQHNKKLVDQMPAVYQTGNAGAGGKTSLLVFTGDHAVFGGAEARRGPLQPFPKIKAPARRDEEKTDQPLVHPLPGGPRLRDITDGTANTLLAVSAGSDKLVPWTKPEDLPFQPANPLAALGAIPEDGFVAVFFDGRVERLPKDIDPARFGSFIDSTEHARKRAAP
jgi:hypothetical protein